MPMTPHKGEDKSAFMQRCMHETATDDRPNDQAVAICMSYWRKGAKAKSFAEVLADKRRGPPRLAQAIGTRAMDEEGLPVIFPGSEDFEDDPETPDPREDDEDGGDLADEVADELELRAKSFAEVMKQPSVQGVHAPTALGNVSAKEKPKDDDEKKKDEAAAEKHWSLPLKFTKIDPDQRLVFGWASVATKDGKLIVDKQGDIIEPETLEKAAYDFMLYSRKGGSMHDGRQIGHLVESIAFTKQKQDALGVDLGMEGWWTGFRIDDDEVWKSVKAGELTEFSIGGVCHSAEVENMDTYLAHKDVFTDKADQARGRRHARPSFRW